MASLAGKAKTRAVYELGGPEILTMKEVMQRVLAYAMRKRWLVPLPFFLAKLQGAILQLLPSPPLTLDQVRLLERDNVVSERRQALTARTLAGLGITEPVAGRGGGPRLSSSSIAPRASSPTTSPEGGRSIAGLAPIARLAGWPGPQLPSGAGAKCAP